MAIIDERTPNLNLPIPVKTNALKDDVGRLREAFDMLDNALGDASVVGSEAEMLALNVNPGSKAVRTDTGETFVLAEVPASSIDSWKKYAGEQSTLVVLAQPDGYTKVGGIQSRWDKEEKSVIYAINHGIIASGSIDSSDALQNLIDISGSTPIILPPIIGLKKTVKYRTNTVIKGMIDSFTQVNLMSGFVGNSAFEPISKLRNGAISPVLTNLTITDVTAKNVGAGSDSTKNGIDATGTFNATFSNITGVRIKDVIYSEPGTEVQHTRRTKIHAVNGSNVDRHINFIGSGGDRFAYGDIYVSDFKTSSNCLKQSVVESSDGIQIEGGVIFPNGGLRLSGHYINIVGLHLFEPKAGLDDPETPSGIHIVPRSNNEFSRNVNISTVTIAFPGRLANTTSGNPPQTNKPAPGILLEKVQDFNISVTINNSTIESAKLIQCSNGLFDISSKEANTQLLGSGALTPGTYDTLVMESCSGVVVKIADDSPSRRYAVNISDDCVGCNVFGSVSRGYVIGQNVKIPNNNKNRVLLNIGDSGSSRVQYDSTPPMPRYVNSDDGSTTPSVTGGVNNTVVKFQNGAVTNVTDLPDVVVSMEVTINLNDNNATRIVDVSNGGKFKTRLGANIMGKGTYARFIRDAATGYLVQL